MSSAADRLPMVRDVGKLALLSVALVGMFVLRAIEAIEPAGFYTLTGSIIGYLCGNGVLAAKGQPPSPAFGYYDRRDGAPGGET